MTSPLPRQTVMSHFARTAIAFAVLISSAMATDPVPPALNDISTYLVCAGEGQSFVLPSVCDVAYGANGKFVFKAAQSGTIIFNTTTFGDPIPGVVKSGYFRYVGGFGSAYVAGTGTGLTGDYRNLADLTGSHIRRNDPIINFPWGSGSPAPGISADNFIVRWTGQIQTRFDGDCTLSTTSDDGLLLFIDGKLLINEFTNGGKAKTCTFASKAGQKHDIRIEYFEYTGNASMYLRWQSANEMYALVPTSCLYPYNMANAIPASSTVSPAFLEGFYGFTVPVMNKGTVSDLGESRFYANVPLSASAATAVTLTEGSTTASGNITWTPTVLTNGKIIVVRPGDALLLKAVNAGALTINKNYAAYRAKGPIAAGQAIPVTFSEPGTYTILEDNAAGARLIEMTVRVPGVVAEENPIACAVNYTRVKDINLVGAADKDLVTWAASGPWIQLNPVTVTSAPATQVQFTLKPTENRAGWLMGRINGETGAILTNKLVRPFVIALDSEKYNEVTQTYPDGTRLLTAHLTMTPLVLGLTIVGKINTAGTTFLNSTTHLTASSTTFALQANGSGVLAYDILAAPNVNSICHGMTTYQDTAQVAGEDKSNGKIIDPCDLDTEKILFIQKIAGAAQVLKLNVLCKHKGKDHVDHAIAVVPQNGKGPTIAPGTTIKCPDPVGDKNPPVKIPVDVTLNVGVPYGKYDVTIDGKVFSERIIVVEADTLTLTEVAEAKDTKKDTTHPDTTPVDPDDRLILVPVAGAQTGTQQASMIINLTWLPTDADRKVVGKRMRWKIIKWENEDLVTGWDKNEGDMLSESVKVTWTSGKDIPRRCRVRAWADANADGKLQAESSEIESARLLKVVLVDAGFVQVWQEVPAVLEDKALNPNDSKAFTYKFFVFGDESTPSSSAGSDCQFKVEASGGSDPSKVREETTVESASDYAWLPGDNSQAQKGKLYSQSFAFTKEGIYQMVVIYKGKRFVPRGLEPTTTTAFLGSITGMGKEPNKMLEGKNGTDIYGILPASIFKERKAPPSLHPPFKPEDSLPEKPDQPLTDTWGLKSAPSKKNMFFAPAGSKASTLEFGTGKFATFALSPKRDQVTLTPTAVGGDGDLIRNKTKGLFYMNGKAVASMRLIGKPPYDWALFGADSQQWLPIQSKSSSAKVNDLAGNMEPFYLIVPALTIKTPNGDPKSAANATNELVFDKAEKGKCIFDAEADDLTTLSDKGRGIVHPLCTWISPNVGAVAAVIKPQAGKKVAVTYDGMPAKHTDFGRKRLTMGITGKAAWQWYAHAEFFFNKESSAIAANGKDPDWFFYWNQTATDLGYKPHAPIAYQAGQGSTGKDGLTTWTNTPGENQPLLINITMYETSGASGITQYIGVLHHENGHVDSIKLPAPDGFGPQAIWNSVVDSDEDLILDAFERTNAASGYKITKDPVVQKADGVLRIAWEHTNPFVPKTNAGLTTKYQDEVIAKDAKILPLDWSDKGQNHAK